MFASAVRASTHLGVGGVCGLDGCESPEILSILIPRSNANIEVGAGLLTSSDQLTRFLGIFSELLTCGLECDRQEPFECDCKLALRGELCLFSTAVIAAVSGVLGLWSSEPSKLIPLAFASTEELGNRWRARSGLEEQGSNDCGDRGDATP